MRVSKWGNSLAIRLPAAIVDGLSLSEGDEIEVEIAGARHFNIRRDTTRDKALARLRALKQPLPAGFVFSRDDANAR